MNRKRIILTLIIIILLSFIAMLVLYASGIQNEMEQQEDSNNVKEQVSYENEEPSNEQDGEDSQESVDSVEQEESMEEEPSAVWYEEGNFELPIIGAGGYTSVLTPLYDSPTEEAESMMDLSIGTPFEIQEEQGRWWRVQTEKQEGWIENTLAMINLPDVIPSIVYDNPNNYGSEFKSSFTDIPEVTGKVLYNGIEMNERLGHEEFIMPIIYNTAEKIAQAQKRALSNGETLVIKESFRPRSVQLFINKQLSNLAEENETVAAGLKEEPWSMHWFIHSGISNHQRGVAVDLTLAQIERLEETVIGDFLVPNIVDYTEYEMHTPVFELSIASVMLEWPVAARDRTAWQDIPVREGISEHALRLREVMFEADMIPIASEWWHFNDVDMLEEFEEDMGNGDFYLEKLFNRKPILEDLES